MADPRGKLHAAVTAKPRAHGQAAASDPVAASRSVAALLANVA